jgi:hypothetical protein
VNHRLIFTPSSDVCIIAAFLATQVVYVTTRDVKRRWNVLVAQCYGWQHGTASASARKFRLLSLRNRISSLPLGHPRLTSHLRSLFFRGNPLINPLFKNLSLAVPHSDGSTPPFRPHD